MTDGRVAKSLGLLDLLVEVCGCSWVMPFCVYEEFGGKSQEAILGCNVLAVLGVKVDAVDGYLERKEEARGGHEECRNRENGGPKGRPVATGELFNCLNKQQVGMGLQGGNVCT